MMACSSVAVWVRPIQNSPAGIAAMLAGGWVSVDWASIVRLKPDATHEATKAVTTERKTDNGQPFLDKQIDMILRDEGIRPDRRRLDVVVRPTGGRVFDLLPPVDTESRIDGRNQVVDLGLFPMVPPGVDARRAVVIGSADHALALDPAPHQQ